MDYETDLNTFEEYTSNHRNDDDLEIMDPTLNDLNENNINETKHNETNPFYLGESASTFTYIPYREINKTHQYVYIICRKCESKQNINSNENTKYSNPETMCMLTNIICDSKTQMICLKKYTSLLTCLRAPLCIAKNAFIRQGLLTVKSDVIELFNHQSYNMNDTVLACLMLEVYETSVEKWINLYTNCSSELDEFIKMKIFTSYYDINDKICHKYLIDVIKNSQEFQYWSDLNNCMINNDHKFINRKFNLSFIKKWKIPVTQIESELRKILINFNKSNIKHATNNTGNYPSQITNISDNKLKINAANKLKTLDYRSNPKNKSFYKIFNTDDINPIYNNIEDLFKSRAITEQEKYYLVTHMLISKTYCHFILKNKNILQQIHYMWEKYAPLFKYLLGYSVNCLYMEEMIKKTKTVKTDRYVFTLEEASQFPSFPFTHDNPYMSPYFTMLVDRSLLNLSGNFNGPSVINGLRYGVVDLIEFRRRLNIFVSGNSKMDLFKGANWNNMVITGSCMSAILPVNNPLFTLFTQTKINKNGDITMKDGELLRFYQEYYAHADIDIACNHTNIIDFIKHAEHIKSVIHKNLNENNIVCNESDIDIKPVKTLTLTLNSKILMELCKSGKIPYTYNIIKENKNTNNIKYYFYEMYLNKKLQVNIENKKNLGELINHENYFKIICPATIEDMTILLDDYSDQQSDKKIDSCETKECDTEIRTHMYIYANRYRNSDESQNEDNTNYFIKCSETFKYTISSRYLKNKIELFRIQHVDFFGSISRFHLPCVRSYYDGSNCYILLSALIAYLTFTNIHFNYFIGSRDPISIINKFRMRGYTTILTEAELKHAIAYILTIPEVRSTYGIEKDDDYKELIGTLPLTAKFFHYRQQCPEKFIPDNTISMQYKTNTLPLFSSSQDVIKYYETKYPTFPSNLLSMCSITKEGTMDPVKKWIIDAAFDLL